MTKYLSVVALSSLLILSACSNSGTTPELNEPTKLASIESQTSSDFKGILLSDGSLELEWKKKDGTKTYNLTRSSYNLKRNIDDETNGVADTVILTLGEPYYLDTNIVANTVYDYSVTAVDENLNESPVANDLIVDSNQLLAVLDSEDVSDSDGVFTAFTSGGNSVAQAQTQSGTIEQPELGAATSEPAVSVEPVAVEPVAVEPVAVEPVAVEPVAVEPVAVEPVAVEPVAVEPVAVEPVAVEPVAVEPVAVEPVAVEPVAVEPVAVEPVAVEPVAVEPVAVEPVAVEPVAVEPVINLVAPESVPAFPGAEGHGAESIGGRGGIVVKVTNLNDSGPGSLREALTMTVPRIIVFEVSGTIDLQSRIYVRAVNSFFTLAGQTAPGDGIAIRNHLLGFVGVQHGIVRHLRVRHGCPAGCNISIADNIHILAGTNNLILDHISMTWHNDENINIYGDNIHDVTVQRSIMAEGGTLCYEGATHVSGEKHNLGALFTGADHSRITFAKNYMAHSCYRNYQQSSGQYEYINGINYNTSKLDFSFTQVPATAYEPLQADIVGYHFKEGPQTITHHLYDLLRYGAASTNAETWPQISLHVYDVTATTSDGSPHPFAPNGSLDNAVKYRTLGGTSTMPVLERRTTPSVQAKYPVSVVPSTQVPDKILPSVGASKPKRDPVDERIVNDFYSLGIWEVSNINQYPVLSTYDVQTDTDNDGMPDSWETNNGLDPFSADDQNGDINNDGYTNIENYINSI